MPLINNAFNGKLNTDVADYRISNGDYLDALNVTRDAEVEGQDKIVSNILGNTQIPLALPSTGVNKVIGQYADKVRDRLYYFVWNSLGYNRICFYDAKTNSNNIVLESKTQSSGVDILKFNPSNKILSVNVIHRDEGDLLCFLDTNLNEPRVINILDNFGVNWKEEYLSVAKAPPIMPIKCVYENDNEASSITTDLLNAPINAFDNNDVSGEYSIKFDFSSNSYFSLSYDKQTITYTATPNTVKLKLNLNLYADVNNYNIKIVVNGLDVSTESLSGNVYYKELTLPALSTGSYISVKVSNYLGGVFTAQGNLNASSSFASTTAKVTINNLRNSLFQFRYRYVYDNFEKSVWSTDSIVPLPYQLSESLTSQQSNKYTDNARISLSFSSGNEQVSKIEIAFRRFSNNFTSDWQLIDQLNKSEQSIPDNDIVTYKFYNDGIYNPIDILDTEKLQDYVPQKANAGELINGNTLVYSGITEGYDSIKPSISVETSISNTIPSPNTFYYDYNGVLFFASINGNDSGSKGTTMKVYIYGVGTNTGNEVSTLSNAKAEFVIKAIDGSGVNKGGSYVSTNDSVTVSSILGGISSSLVAKGWTQVSIVKNVLTLSYPTNITLLSSGTLLQTDTLNNTTTSFANVFEGSYQVGLMYFDSKGRTNGVITSASGSYNTPANGTGVLSSPTPTNYCKPIVSIASRPPKWASYYQVVRSNNTTYNKRLFWISNSAYSSLNATLIVDNAKSKYAYIGIDNLDYYNEEIKATEGVVFYNFTQGDRIRFIKRYVGNNTVEYINYDYEVLGVEVNPNIDGTVKTGRFIKINYPTSDISISLKFDGSSDYQNYEILIYNYTQKTTSKNKLFFEFGRCFGIGNAGTDNSYHIGDVATQSSTNFATVPAKVSIINGDLFYRKRSVPISDFYTFIGEPDVNDLKTSLIITVPTTIDNSIYKIQSEIRTELNEAFGSFPTYANNLEFFHNKSANSIDLNIKALMQFYDGFSDNAVIFKAMVITATDKKIIPLTKLINTFKEQALNGVVSEYNVDSIIRMPPTSKLYLYIDSLVTTGSPTTTLRGFQLNMTVVKSNPTIDIIETSFSDVYNIVTNSNGRETIVDENAKQTYFPTLTRFSQSYQADTNINGTNRFYPDNFDTYDRGFGDVIRLHVRDRYMKVYQQLKVGNVPILTQIVKDVTGNPLQANSDQLINKIQYYSGDYGIGDAGESLAWNNFADYFVDNYRGVVCRLSQDGITPISIINSMNAFFASKLPAYRKELNSSEVVPDGQIYKGKPCIYGAFDAFTNKYIIVMEEINRYEDDSPL
jgi:hypothetical protein